MIIEINIEIFSAFHFNLSQFTQQIYRLQFLCKRITNWINFTQKNSSIFIHGHKKRSLGN